MSDVSYNGRVPHSIYIQIGSLTKNTWDDWGLAPKSRPYINPAKPQTDYVEVPGRSGSLDYTEILLGSTQYDYREGTFKFYITLEKHNNADELYTLIMLFLHGKEATVWLEDDPDKKYKGRLVVSSYSVPSPGFSELEIDYSLLEVN